MEDVVKTSSVLIAYCGVLVCFPLGDIVNNIFFSRKDTKTPIKINLALFAPGIAVKILFLRIWGYIGIADSSSLMNALKICVSLFFLKRKQPVLRFRKVLINFFQNMISFTVSAMSIYTIRSLINLDLLLQESSKFIILLKILIQFLLFSLLYIVVNVLIRNELILESINAIKMRRIREEKP